VTAGFEVLKEQAIALRRDHLGAVARDPEGHGWPDAFVESRRTKRGEAGVTLSTLAKALGCHWQTVKSIAGDPLGTIVSGNKPVDIWDPASLERLVDDPKVVAGRDKRVTRLNDTERLSELYPWFAGFSDFQLTHVGVSAFRSIADADFRLDALTVLIGRNGVGKSSLLDALRLGLEHGNEFGGGFYSGSTSRSLVLAAAGSPPPGSDPGLRAAYCALGLPAEVDEVVFELLRAFLLRPAIVGAPGRWQGALVEDLDGFDRSRIEDLPMTKSGSRLADELLAAAASDGLLNRGVPSLALGGPGLQLLVLGGDIDAIGERLYEQVPGIPDLPHQSNRAQELVANLRQLLDEGRPEVDRAEPTSVRLGWVNQTGTPSLPGHADCLEIEIESVHETVRRRVPLNDVGRLRRIHDELSDLLEADEVVDEEEVTAGLETIRGLLRMYGPGGNSDSPWFAQDNARRVGALAALLVVEDIANQLAPTFVAEQGRIVLLPPADPEARWVGVVLVGLDGGATDLEVLPSGIKRWVVLLIELAKSLSRDKWRQVDRSDFADRRSFEQDILGSAAALAREVADLQVTSKSMRLLLADEPELHLHPAAQEEIVHWFIRMSVETATLVATHAPAFLQMSPGEGRLVRVSRARGIGTSTTALDGDFLQSLDAVGSDLGLGRERLLQLVRAFVVVEGEADRFVLRRFAQAMLDRNRLCVVPIDGHLRSHAMVNSGFAAAIGLPIAILFDEVSAADLDRFLAGDANVADEVKSAAKILRLRERGLNCEVIPFDVHDVIEAIPEATIRRQFPSFDSWAGARDRWSAHKSGCKSGDKPMAFKNFVLDEWKVDRKKDRSTIEQLATSRRPDEALPAAVVRALSSIEAWATTLGAAPVPSLASDLMADRELGDDSRSIIR
jgi:energy-coupling factor transporter ATP-binding protein EcfA2